MKTQSSATKSEKSQIIVHCFLRDRQDITSVSARKHPRYHLGYILFSLDKKLGTQLLYTITGIVHRPPPHCSENELLFYANVGEWEWTKGAHFKAESIQWKVDFSSIRRPAMFCSGPVGGRPEASGVPFCKWLSTGKDFVKAFLFLFIYLFLIFISWRLITSQHFSEFCHTLTWISHGVNMCSPSRSPLPPPSPPDSSGSSQCTRLEHLSHASHKG